MLYTRLVESSTSPAPQRRAYSSTLTVPMQIVLDELPAAGATVDAGQDRGVGRGVDDPIAHGGDVRSRWPANIAMADRHAGRLQPLPVQLAAGSDETVKAHNLDASHSLAERSATLLPTNPQMPVITMRIKLRAALSRIMKRRGLQWCSLTSV